MNTHLRSLVEYGRLYLLEVQNFDQMFGLVNLFFYVRDLYVVANIR